MRVAALQFDVRRGVLEANLATVLAGLTRAAEQGVRLVVLPEMWPSSFADAGGHGNELVSASEAALDRATRLSGELGIAFCGSSLAPGALGEQPRNRMHLVDRGERRLSYDKVHLFSPTAEHESFSAGDGPPPTIACDFGRVSGVVCYDLRFGPLLEVPFLEGAELLCVPAQWPAPRERHWRALVAGRAVEGQCVVVAANRTGTDHVGRRRLELAFPGSSLVVGADGTTLAEGDGEAGLVVADVDLEEARELSRRVPVRRDRRETLYRSW